MTIKSIKQTFGIPDQKEQITVELTAEQIREIVLAIKANDELNQNIVEYIKNSNKFRDTVFPSKHFTEEIKKYIKPYTNYASMFHWEILDQIEPIVLEKGEIDV